MYGGVGVHPKTGLVGNTLSVRLQPVFLNKNPIKKGSNERLKFFNLGKDNNWRNILSKNIINEIEKEFKIEMKELGYL